MARRILRWLGIAVLVIGYPLLAHYTNESARHGNLGALVAIGGRHSNITLEWFTGCSMPVCNWCCALFLAGPWSPGANRFALALQRRCMHR